MSAKYSFNENYFSSIKNKNQAYILGFIAADGNIHKREGNQHQIRISIKDVDIEILEFILQEFESTHPIKIQVDERRPEKTTMASITFLSDAMAKDLLKYGVGERKTFNYSILYTIEQLHCQFISSFLLGYFDGDGNVDLRGSTISRSHVRFSGPLKNMIELQKILEKVSIPSSVIEDKRKYTKPFGSLEATNTTQKYAILRFLYDSATSFSLSRKRIVAKELMRRIEENVTNRSENIKAVEYYSVVVKREELLGTPNE